jgi:hypothetical protein
MTVVAAQLDAMLHGWLEHAADRRRPGRPGARLTAVLAGAAVCRRPRMLTRP